MFAPLAARILVVDDEEFITEIVALWLEAEGHDCATSRSAQEVLRRPDLASFDLVISDINMLGMTGIDLFAELRQRDPELAVILATAVDDRETAIRALHDGAYGYMIKPLYENEVIIAVENALERRRLQLLSNSYHHKLERTVERRTEEIRRGREEISLLLVAASEFRDSDTGKHVRRMGLYAEALARALGWGDAATEDMRLAAPMHDIGKIGIPDKILLKPDRLTDEEFEAIKEHVAIGARLLGSSDVPLLRLASEIAESHHEKWDGSGYPHGRQGEDIPASARLVAITDVYDALTHDRVYRPALAESAAIAIMYRGRASHFDPTMFDVFMRLLPEIRRIRSRIGSTNDELVASLARKECGVR